MSPVPDQNPAFEPPAPGLWVTDKIHFIRPPSRLMLEVALPAAAIAGAESPRRYGLLADGFESAVINGFRYNLNRSALSGIEGETEHEFHARMEADAEIALRRLNAEYTLESRRWRDDLLRWDRQLKPAALAANLNLAAVDPCSLDDPGLHEYISACLDHWGFTCYLHHVPNPVTGVPVSRLVLFASEVANCDAGEAIALLTGSMEATGPASEEASEFRAAMRRDPNLLRWAGASEPDHEFLGRLLAWPGEAGRAARRFTRITGFRGIGQVDLLEPSAIEQPGTYARTVHAAIFAEPAAAPEPSLEPWRDRVDETHWEDFVDLVTEARLVARVRDERGLYCNIPARGLTRLALLEAGRRLVERGVLGSPEHLLEAGREEIDAILDGVGGPRAETLADRHAWRSAASAAYIPDSLGRPSSPPLRLEWLPGAFGHLARAAALMAPLGIAGNHAVAQQPVAPRQLRGAPVSPGTFTGPVVLVRDTADLDRVAPGTVLVTQTTSPAFNVVFSLVGAVVTDFGGVLSHAAILAREYRLPCVVGCKDATRLIPEGAMATVDGQTGAVSWA